MASAPQTWRLTPAEVPYTRRLGQGIRFLRTDAGWSRHQLADAVCMASGSIANLELGRRRTRRSTLQEIAKSLGVATDRDPTEVLEWLVALAGPALAVETAKSPTSIARKRARRRRENLKRDLAKLNEIVGDDEPVSGGPEFMLRRRALDAAQRVFRTDL